MSDHKRLSKMISLRLSAEEYEALRTLYPNYGARNVSDFARMAIQRVIGNSLASDGLVTTVNDLDRRLAASNMSSPGSWTPRRSPKL